MMLALLGVAINACETEHPDPLVREAAQMPQVVRQELVEGLRAETWAVIRDTMPGTDPKPVDVATPYGTYSFEFEPL